MHEATSAVMYRICSVCSASTGGNCGKPPELTPWVIGSKGSVSNPGSNTLAIIGYKMSTFAKVADKYPLTRVSLNPCCV